MPWIPELFSEPALARIRREAAEQRAAEPVPYFDGIRPDETEALIGSSAGEPERHHPVWGLLQEITTRLAGGIEPAATSFASASDLSQALQRAAAAHGEHEKRIGREDPDWPDWYAEYMVRAAAGEELPL
jgi:hypothetical protein